MQVDKKEQRRMTRMKMKNVIKHKLPETHEEWLNDRLRGIGGSDAGAVLGLNPYKSAYALWCEKTGRIHKDIDNERMRFGRDMEEYVAKRWEEETGKKCRRSGFSYQSVDHPFMLANVDRLVVGEEAGLEIKTTSEYNKKLYEGNNIPPSYYAQCMHYMAVTGLKKWYIAILIPGMKPFCKEVLWDDKEINALIAAEEKFWKCVEEDKEPPIDNSESTAQALATLYPTSNDEETVDLTPLKSQLELYAKTKSKIKELQEQQKECENELKHYLGEASLGMVDGFKVSWKTVNSNRFDSKSFKEAEPKIYAQYLNQSSSRRLLVKEL